MWLQHKGLIELGPRRARRRIRRPWYNLTRQIRRTWYDLTPRESEVALLLERNLSNDEIASELDIKRGTVQIHVHNILVKLKAPGRPGRASKGGPTTAAGRERIREAQRRRWQRWRAARSGDNT
jgi:DNA-binding NarL/FixJ family response regulator